MLCVPLKPFPQVQIWLYPYTQMIVETGILVRLEKSLLLQPLINRKCYSYTLSGFLEQKSLFHMILMRYFSTSDLT